MQFIFQLPVYQLESKWSAKKVNDRHNSPNYIMMVGMVTNAVLKQLSGPNFSNQQWFKHTSSKFNWSLGPTLCPALILPLFFLHPRLKPLRVLFSTHKGLFKHRGRCAGSGGGPDTYHLGSGWVRPQVDETAMIAAYPRPKTNKEVRRFLGLASYFWWFIPCFADLTSPMTDLTRKSASDLVQWTEPCQVAFEKVKWALCGEPLLHTQLPSSLSPADQYFEQEAGGRFVSAGAGQPPGALHQLEVIWEGHGHGESWCSSI